MVLSVECLVVSWEKAKMVEECGRRKEERKEEEGWHSGVTVDQER